ncbi:MAG: hypothetical protein ACRYG8_25590 [Janthinobacterium lividum]
MGALSRRALFASGAGLAIAGTAVAAPPPAASPDAELIRLCAAIDALQLRFDALCDGPEKIEDDDARMDAVAPITAEQLPLIERMCEIRPTTLQGHMARARTYWLWDKDPPEADSPYTNEAMQGAILRDLAALVGEGA